MALGDEIDQIFRREVKPLPRECRHSVSSPDRQICREIVFVHPRARNRSR
jgi:hypothetical protein